MTPSQGTYNLAALAEALSDGGHPVTTVHVDDFRRPLELTGLEPQAETDAYYDRYYDFDAVGTALASLCIWIYIGRHSRASSGMPENVPDEGKPSIKA